MSGRPIAFLFPSFSDTQKQVGQALGCLREELVREELGDCCVLLEWDATDREWFAARPFDDEVEELPKLAAKLQGFVFHVDLISLGYEMPATISFFHPEGDSRAPLGLHIVFGTIVDRNLFPDGSTSPEEEPNRALHHAVLALATALESEAFAIEHEEDGAAIRPLDVGRLLRMLRHPPGGQDPEILPMLSGVSNKLITYDEMVAILQDERGLSETTSGYVLVDIYAGEN
jgi:hypothetical protein